MSSRNGSHRLLNLRTFLLCLPCRRLMTCVTPRAWSFSTWPQVVMALPNASRLLTQNTFMPLPPLCVPNPFVKHVFTKRLFRPHWPCQMSHLPHPSHWGFTNALCWQRRPWQRLPLAVPQYAATARPGRVGRQLGLALTCLAGPTQALALGAGVAQASPHPLRN